MYTVIDCIKPRPVNRLDLVSARHKEMEDGFRVGLHRENNI